MTVAAFSMVDPSTGWHQGLVPPEDRVSGPGTTVIMAAFTHLNPAGSRFSDGTYGVFHSANNIDTAIGETRHLCYLWNGHRIAAVHEKRQLEAGNG